MVFGVSNVILFFYGCILMLLFRIKQDLVKILVRFVNDVFYSDHRRYVKSILDLPVIQFGDLQDRRGQRSFDEFCFICLKEYERDDVLTQLSRCGHVYHTDCIGIHINDYEFTCPFCKSSIFKSVAKS
ncbi:putative chromatin regulator PHD family [Helianthus annuus]|nr:putative chromatin regulator PHD family [Helianthus annuus]